MHRFIPVVSVLLLASGISAWAGVPDPSRSGCGLKGDILSCQYRFRANGELDCLTLCVTVRDAFDVPVVNCSTSATVSLAGPKPASGCWVAEGGSEICTCDGFTRAGVTDGAGVVVFDWCTIGGRGVGEIAVTTHCLGQIEICSPRFNFTSTSTAGTCEPTVQDLGIWAACFRPNPACQSADYNCDCQVDVLDLGVWAGGFLLGCGP